MGLVAVEPAGTTSSRRTRTTRPQTSDQIVASFMGAIARPASPWRRDPPTVRSGTNARTASTSGRAGGRHGFDYSDAPAAGPSRLAGIAGSVGMQSANDEAKGRRYAAVLFGADASAPPRSTTIDRRSWPCSKPILQLEFRWDQPGLRAPGLGLRLSAAIALPFVGEVRRRDRRALGLPIAVGVWSLAGINTHSPPRCKAVRRGPRGAAVAGRSAGGRENLAYLPLRERSFRHRPDRPCETERGRHPRRC